MLREQSLGVADGWDVVPSVNGWMYLFPMTSVTNCCKFNALKQHRTIFQFWKPEAHYGSHCTKIKTSVGLSSFAEALGARCPTFGRLWATLEEEDLSWATH